MRQVIDLTRWQDYLHIYIGGEIKKTPQLRERLPREFGFAHTQDTVVNILWNEIHKSCKYEWDRWDVDGAVEKWFTDYYPHRAEYKRHGKVYDETDYESEQIMEALLRLQNKISRWVHDNELPSRWRIYELYSHGKETFVVAAWGDWRAQQWSREHGKRYEYEDA
jgi:serine protease inhibitor